MPTPVALYRLNEQAGTVINDSVGTNNGTWTGTDVVTNGTFTTAGGGGTEIISGWDNVATTANIEVQHLDVGEFHGGTTVSPATANLWTDDGTQVFIRQDAILTVGKVYTLTFDVIFNGGGLDVRSYDRATTYEAYTTDGTKTLVFTATDAGISFTRTFGGNIDATIDNAVIREHVDSVSSPAGKGLLFDGVDDEINVADNSALNFGTSPFTITCWVNTVNADTIANILSKQDSGEGYLLRQESAGSGKWNFAISSDGVSGDVVIVSDSPPKANVWQHLAGTRDSSGNMVMYVDGVAQLDIGLNPDNINNIGTLYIGGNGLTNPFNGSISGVRIYDAVLTAGEIRGISSQGRLLKHVLRNGYEE